LLVEEFECHEGIDERSIHVDDALCVLGENECTILAVSHFVVVVACREIGHFIDVVGKWIIGTGVSFVCGVICVEGRIHHNIQQVYLLGDC